MAAVYTPKITDFIFDVLYKKHPEIEFIVQDVPFGGDYLIVKSRKRGTTIWGSVKISGTLLAKSPGTIIDTIERELGLWRVEYSDSAKLDEQVEKMKEKPKTEVERWLEEYEQPVSKDNSPTADGGR